MTDDRIKAVFEEYGRIVTGKEYALIHAIAEAVAPQRTWVGLTDDEINAMFSEALKGNKLVAYVARAIEGKLKEKNEFC